MSFFEKLKYAAARLLNRRPCAIKNAKIHPKASVRNGAQFVNSSIGKYSYIHGSTAIHTEIGAFCSIAGGCTIGGGSHPAQWVSTSPVFYTGRNVLKTNFSQNKYSEYKKTVIGNDVWIGAKCLIKGGVTIGDGAVIGMGSVVTHDVPPYEIWAGNPARKIRDRFDPTIAKALLESKWWTWEEPEIISFASHFSNPELFLTLLKQKKDAQNTQKNGENTK